MIYRTDVVHRYPPYPIFEGEKYLSLGWLYEQIDQDYELLILNEPLVRVEYQPDGSSLNMFRQYIRNPRSFAFIRKSSILAKNWHFLSESPRKILTLCAIPFGIALYGYIKWKTKGIK